MVFSCIDFDNHVTKAAVESFGSNLWYRTKRCERIKSAEKSIGSLTSALIQYGIPLGVGAGVGAALNKKNRAKGALVGTLAGGGVGQMGGNQILEALIKATKK